MREKNGNFFCGHMGQDTANRARDMAKGGGRKNNLLTAMCREICNFDRVRRSK